MGLTLSAFAQNDYSDLSQNHKTANGYEFNWNTSANTSVSPDDYNCIENSKIYNPNRIYSGDIYTYSVQNDALTLHQNGSTVPWNIIRPFEDCEEFLIDLSKFKNPVIKYKVRTDADLNYLGLRYMHIDANEKLEDEFISDVNNTGTSFNVNDGWVEGSFEIEKSGFLTGIAIHPSVTRPLPHSPQIANIEFDYIKIVEGEEPVVTTIIEEETTIVSLISPNPASNFVTIQLEKEDLQVVILNALGEEALHIEMEGKEKNVDISSLQTGVYFVQIREEGNVLQTERLIVK